MKELEKNSEVKNLADIGINLKGKMNKYQTKAVNPPSLELGKNNFI